MMSDGIFISIAGQLKVPIVQLYGEGVGVGGRNATFGVKSPLNVATCYVCFVYHLLFLFIAGSSIPYVLASAFILYVGIILWFDGDYLYKRIKEFAIRRCKYPDW